MMMFGNGGLTQDFHLLRPIMDARVNPGHDSGDCLYPPSS
jgi:hypothetical protein